MDDIHSILLQRYCDLVDRADVFDEQGLAKLAELLRDEADIVLSRFADIRLRDRQRQHSAQSA